jgi:hypothetical protein
VTVYTLDDLRHDADNADALRFLSLEVHRRVLWIDRLQSDSFLILPHDLHKPFVIVHHDHGY